MINFMFLNTEEYSHQFKKEFTKVEFLSPAFNNSFVAQLQNDKKATRRIVHFKKDGLYREYPI